MKELWDRTGLGERAERVYAQQDAEHRARTDRLFAILAVVLWIATLALFSLNQQAEVAFQAMLNGLGGIIAIGLIFVAIPVVSTVRFPGHRFSPFLAAVSLSVCTVLFVRVSGRADSELAAFVILAFLAFYRNGRALALANLILIGDIVLRTADNNHVFGSLIADLVSAKSEDIAWLLIFDLVLYASITNMAVGLRRGSAQQANLEALHEESTHTIAARDQELQESETIKTIIFEAAPDAVIRYDSDLRIVEINAVAEKMLAIPRSEAAGKSLGDFLLNLDQLSAKGDDLGRTADAGSFFEVTVRRSDDSEFFAECYSSSVLGMDTPQYAMFVRDITERKALEGQLAQSQKLQSIGQLAAGIAHEINTPTQYVGDNTLFLKDAFTDVTNVLDAYDGLAAVESIEEMNERLESIEQKREEADLEFLREEIPKALGESLDGIQRISVIVRALKDFSHPGVDGMTSADVNRILESTATVARNEWKYVAHLELDLCGDLPPILCLPGELGQVALNLIVNASHAIADRYGKGGEKGTIRVSSSHDGQHITVKISDDGAGIPAAVRERVFDPFFTTKEVGKGTGQGLALAHNVIVERHGGQIWFETQEGEGTTFLIRIPMVRKESDEQGEAA